MAAVRAPTSSPDQGHRYTRHPTRAPSPRGASKRLLDNDWRTIERAFPGSPLRRQTRSGGSVATARPMSEGYGGPQDVAARESSPSQTHGASTPRCATPDTEWSATVRTMPDVVLSVHAGRPRPGKRFEPVRELELSEDVLRAAQTLPGAHRGVRVLLETAGPFGVPDLLAVVGPLTLLEARLALDVPPLLNQVDAGVVAAAASGVPRSASTLARRLGWSLETVTRRLPRLLRTGALVRVGPETYIRPQSLGPVGRLYAVEAKVRDWRRAVRQARTYSVWCDSYVIVMPTLGSGSLPGVVEAVSADRGGLMIDGTWVRRPRISQRSTAQRLWGSEHAIAAFDS